jgi:hypothetical protein
VVGGRTFLSAASEPYACGVRYVSTGGSFYFGAASSSATPDGVFSQAGGAERMRITDGGNVGIGTSSPSYKLDVSGTGRFTSSLSVLTGATTTAGLIVGGDATVANTWTIARDNVTTGDLKFIGNTTERMRIDSSGNLLVGTTSSILSGLVSVLSGGTAGSFRISASAAAGIVLDLSRTAATGDMVYFRTSSTTLAGYITCPTGTTTSYLSVSDYRLKENVKPMTGALEKISALKPCTYTWKADGSAGQGFHCARTARSCARLCSWR